MFLNRPGGGGGGGGRRPPLSLAPPFPPADSDADAYLATLRAAQQLLAELLGVHALSQALAIRAHAPLAADAPAWWRALQQRSIAATQPQRQRRQLPETLAELPAADSDRLRDAHADALLRVLQTLDRANRRRFASANDGDAHGVALESVDDAVAFAAAQLLASWETRQCSAAATAAVNMVLQCCGVGARHAFHPHVLLASCARRVFAARDATSWKCAVCSRLAELKGPAAAPLVYRCAACDFNLCRECFTRIPNRSASSPSSLDVAVNSAAAGAVYGKKLEIAGFFQLAFRELDGNELFSTIAGKLAFELRQRVKELPVYKVADIAACSELLVDMLTHPTFALQVVKHAECDWFPLYMNTSMMGFLSFLGPFLRGTTMSDELGGGRGSSALDGSAAMQALGNGWQDGFRSLKKQFMAILRALVAKTQHPYVAHATLCWLGCTVLSTSKRRRMNRETNDMLDGFLLNVSTALVLLSLPNLDADERSPGLLDASYHVGPLSQRAFGDKSVREAPLRELASVRGELYVREKEKEVEERLRSLDRQHIQRYNDARMPCAEAVTQKEAEREKSLFYPIREAHFGVACNHCYQQNFRGVRYKCAFCDDIDICGSCFAHFCRQSDLARGRIDGVLTTGLGSPQVHMLDHVFIRVGTPVPLYETRHFEMIKFEKELSRIENNAVEELAVRQSLECADCGCSLATASVSFKCSNCFDPRFVCAACVAREERSGDPHEMHAPGHLYFAITSSWRATYSPHTPALRYLSLSHPSALLPRTSSNQETELLYMAVKMLHYGPLLTLSKLVGTLKEMHDLQAFCFCEEEKLKYEAQQRRSCSSASRRSLKLSSHYSVSKARLAELDDKKATTELHLLEVSSVTEWLVFYGKTCRWLLRAASPTQNASKELLTDLSDELVQFPEHFFSDLCDIVYLLGLDRLEYHDVMAELAKVENSGEYSSAVVEPILVMLTQLVASRELTRNPHLRVQALKALIAMLGFFSKSKHNDAVKSAFERSAVLRERLFLGALVFHEEMEKYHVRNNGLVFNSNASSGDHLLWGFLPTRVSVTLLLRYLWQLPSQRKVISNLLQLGPTHALSSSSSSPSPSAASNQLSVLVSGLWSDVAKLLDEGASKVDTLLQLRELQEESALDGGLVALPFRPAMLDGYIALHSKQLRLTFRMLVEALELLSWMGDSAPFKNVMLKLELAEQSARIASFLVASLGAAHESGAWTFSGQLVRDGQLVLAHMVVLIVRCAGLSEQCPASSFWKLVHEGGNAMLQRIGDLDTRARWTLSAVTTRLESAQFLCETVDDESVTDGDEGSSQDETLLEEEEEEEEEEIDEDEALALLEKQAVSAARSAASSQHSRSARGRQAHSLARHLGKRFVSALAKDGRFEYDRFVGALAMLRRPSAAASEEADAFELVDVAWVAMFRDAMKSCREMIALHASMDEFLGEVPEDYLDPLLSTIMTDPVRLPSGQIVDRSVIERHLLSSQHVDPFTREPLTVDMLVPCDALRREIRLYLQSKLQQFTNEKKKEDVLATWGLGWNYLFGAGDGASATTTEEE